MTDRPRAGDLVPSPLTPDPVYVPAPDRHSRTSYRRIGRSGLDLPSLSLGLWQNFGRTTAFAAQREIILRAVDLGVCHFDNADRYGPPHREAQRVFGRVLKVDLRSHRDELVLSTKAGNPVGTSPYDRGGSRKHLLSSLEQSLRDLGTDHVDIFYHHRADPSTPLEETALALAAAVQQGKTLYVGISNYDPPQAQEIVGLLRSCSTPLLAHQIRYSMFARDAEGDHATLAQSESFGLVAYSPLAQGLLTGKYLDAIPPEARARRGTSLPLDLIDDRYRARARALSAMALARGQSLAQLALQWVLRDSVVASALIGASSVEQLEHNAAAVQLPALTEAEIAAIDEMLRAEHPTDGVDRPRPSA